MPQTKEYMREWHKKHASYRSNYLRNWLHGVTKERFEELIAAQQNRCAICFELFDRTNPRGHKYPVIDHDHSCCSGDRSCEDCRRGILCSDCNRGLGSFHDDPVNLFNAIRYLLERPEETNHADSQAGPEPPQSEDAFDSEEAAEESGGSGQGY